MLVCGAVKLEGIMLYDDPDPSLCGPHHHSIPYMYVGDGSTRHGCVAVCVCLCLRGRASVCTTQYVRVCAGACVWIVCNNGRFCWPVVA